MCLLKPARSASSRTPFAPRKSSPSIVAYPSSFFERALSASLPTTDSHRPSATTRASLAGLGVGMTETALIITPSDTIK
ncbi:hypothetical protein BC936DRAFT_141661 [Jimgerdemannia flammicorona]|uniref:Uncharacterized protein n=1 Tax=Jimgerdemannia flammicorona TaxID=994334 RepID=A0A433DFY1_9FUNG|nr:hypothetical protein BC936DRAFT_141661 [Jimgerdemannia flammicorona]